MSTLTGQKRFVARGLEDDPGHVGELGSPSMICGSSDVHRAGGLLNRDLALGREPLQEPLAIHRQGGWGMRYPVLDRSLNHMPLWSPHRDFLPSL